MNVGLIYNLIKIKPQYRIDHIAEFDSEETIEALKSALEWGGHNVFKIEFDDFIFEKLYNLKEKLDIVFNIAEGVNGESRESQIPAILDFLKIPYTGSSTLCLAICLNKQRTKEILHYYNLPTANFCVLSSPKDKLTRKLKYPLIVKLNSEGSSMGLDKDSVCENKKQLKKQIEKVFNIYKKQIIIEEYIEGREFTVGLIGNEKPIVFPVIEAVFSNKEEKYPLTLFEPDEWIIKDLKKAGYKHIPVDDKKAVCPARIDDKLRDILQALAVKAFHSLDCKDWARIDFKVDKSGKPYILELNPIAGIDPTYYFPKAALKAGISYNQLINKILDYAIERYDLKQIESEKIASN